eukprot:g34812.t1
MSDDASQLQQPVQEPGVRDASLFRSLAAEDDPNASGPDNGGHTVTSFARQPMPSASGSASSESQEASAGSQTEENPTDTLVMQHTAFPTDLMHVMPRSAERKEYLATLFALADDLFSLRVKTVYQSTTTIKVLTPCTADFLLAVYLFFLNVRSRVIYEHPDVSSSFRPPAPGLSQRSWGFSEEGVELKEGKMDGDRMLFLQEFTLNGESSLSNVQELLNFDKEALRLFTLADSRCKDDLVTAMGNYLRSLTSRPE